MVLKTTGLNPGFQCKNRFGKIFIGSRDIGKKGKKCDILLEKLDLDTFCQYLRACCIFFKTDFCGHF